jgi:hypothetical protein
MFLFAGDSMMVRKILISKIVLEKMKNLTEKYIKAENGGYIFGRMNPNWIQVLDVSDAGRNAKRTFSGVEIDNINLIEYVEEKVNKDLFIIGTWHSHPRGYNLTPSPTDKSTMKRINEHFDDIHKPIFFITNIMNGELRFEIYMIDKNGSVSGLIEYEIFE